jgi:uncharacterized protein YcsI (UPF0317 family)
MTRPAISLILAAIVVSASSLLHGGAVTTGGEAMQIGIRGLEVKFGKAVVEANRPYHVFFEGGIWHVRSAAPNPKNSKSRVTLEALISAADGRIIKAVMLH